MTEQAWLECKDPAKMLEFLRGKATDRKLRLFAVACCRRICPTVRPKRLRRAIKMAECYAEGTATASEMALARSQLRDRYDTVSNVARWMTANEAAESA